MASRAVGALLGLAAVILFAVSIASPKVTPKLPAWWDGHPSVEGKTYDRMDVHVGLLGASRCFDGDQNCTDLEIDSTFQAIGYGELGLAGVTLLVAILLTVSIWRVGDRRKGVAKLALVVGMLCAAGTAVLVLVGPDLHATDRGRSLAIEVPIGLGLMLFWGALAAMGAASVVALRLEREPLRLKPSLVRMASEQPPGPESLPMMSAPLSPSNGNPLFEGAPQLRPLYDVQGAAPVAPHVQMPSRAPTPLPRDSMRALAGLDTPPAAQPLAGRSALEHSAAPRSASDRPDSGPIEPPPPPMRPAEPPMRPSEPPPPLRVPTIPDGPLRPKTMPPARGKLPPVAPPPPAFAPPRASQPKIGRKTPLAGDKAIPEKVPEKKTIAHAIPPPPTSDDMPAPAKLAAKDARLRTDVDPRLETGMRETDAITAVEVDAEAKAAFVALERQRQLATRHAAETAQMIEGSDTGVEVGLPPPPTGDVGDHTDQLASEPPRADSLSERAPTTNTEEARPTNVMPVAISTAPQSLPPPKAAPTTPTGPTPACPQCEAPMAWVEEHLRFYCKQCRMYF
jgi:hypothetical protein